VNKGLRVKLDSGLLPGQSGLAFDFVRGAKPEEPLMQGDVILMPSVVGGSGLDSMMSSLSDVATKLNQIQFDKISDNLNALLTSSNGAVKGFDPGSDFHRDLERMLDQVNEAARSVRLLADYLTRHPEALIRGRGSKDTDK